MEETTIDLILLDLAKGIKENNSNIKVCEECKKEFIVTKKVAKIKKYCSLYCQGKAKRRRNHDLMYRLQKEWAIKNREHRLAWSREWEKKNYPKRLLKNQKYNEKRKIFNPNYWKDYHNKPHIKKREEEYRKTDKYKELSQKRNIKYRIVHPDYRHRTNYEKVIISERKYNKSSKGRARKLTHQQKRRDKFIKLIGKGYDKPTKELVELVDSRDKKCVYCHTDFDLDIKPDCFNSRYPSYDHLNPRLPFSKINTVRCCIKCNSSKNDSDVLNWCKKNKLIPDKIVYELLDKQKLR